MKHERVGSSSCGRVMACPASLRLSEGLPEPPASVYALEGTLLHTAMELILDEQVKQPEQVIGITLGELTLTEALYHECIVPALRGFDEVVGHSTYVVEQKVMLQTDVGGTADFIYRRGDTAGVGDFKFGAGVAVNAEENPQGLFLLNGIAQTKALRDLWQGAHDYEVAIVAPRQDPRLQMWRTTADGVAAFGIKLMAALRMADSENPPIAAGAHCRWCRAKAICPELLGVAQRALALPAVPPEQLSEWLDKVPLLEQWIAALQEAARTALESGGGVPGWKLVPKRATRVWRDEGGLWNTLQDLGFSLDEVWDTSLKSPAQILKLNKVDATLIEPLIEKKSSGTTLARADDPRPGVMATGNLKALSKRLKAS